jgi:hypothetical protein
MKYTMMVKLPWDLHVFFWCMVIPSWKSLFAHPHDWGLGLYIQFSTPFLCACCSTCMMCSETPMDFSWPESVLSAWNILTHWLMCIMLPHRVGKWSSWRSHVVAMGALWIPNVGQNVKPNIGNGSGMIKKWKICKNLKWRLVSRHLNLTVLLKHLSHPDR